MKRLAAVLLLIIIVSFPVFGGHTQATGRYCPCNNPDSCTGGLSLRVDDEVDKPARQDSAPEIDLILAVLLVLALRYRS